MIEWGLVYIFTFYINCRVILTQFIMTSYIICKSWDLNRTPLFYLKKWIYSLGFCCKHDLEEVYLVKLGFFFKKFVRLWNSLNKDYLADKNILFVILFFEGKKNTICYWNCIFILRKIYLYFIINVFTLLWIIYLLFILCFLIFF